MSTKCELVGVTSIQTDFSMKKNQPPQKKISYLRTSLFSNKIEMKMKCTYVKIELKLKYDTKTFVSC